MRQRSQQDFFPVLAVIGPLQNGLSHRSESFLIGVNGSLLNDVMLGRGIGAVRFMFFGGLA